MKRLYNICKRRVSAYFLAGVLTAPAFIASACGGDSEGKADASPVLDASSIVDAAVVIGDAAAAGTFQAAHAVFAVKCASCHTTGSSGGHNIGGGNIAQAYADSQEDAYSLDGTKGTAAFVRIQNGSMPLFADCSGDPNTDSANASCLTQAEQDLIQAWIDSDQPAP